MSRLRYVVKHLLKSLHTHALVWLTSLLALGFCFFLLGLCSFALVRQDALVPEWLASDTIATYLRVDLPQADLDRLVGDVSTWREVEQVQPVSRRQAHEQLKALLGQGKGLLDGLGEEFLPPSLRITLKQSMSEAGAAREVVARLRQLPAVEEVLYGKDYREWLQSLAGQWTNVWLIPGLLLLLMAVLIVSNSVRVVFGCPKTEASVYRLVGASPFAVRLPYYIEAVLLGTLGALTASGLLAFLGVQVHRLLPGFWGAALGPGGWERAALFGGLMGCGMACGWLGCRMGLGKSR